MRPRRSRRLASASQDFDGNGPSVRYLAAAGDQTAAIVEAEEAAAQRGTILMTHGTRSIA